VERVLRVRLDAEVAQFVANIGVKAVAAVRKLDREVTQAGRTLDRRMAVAGQATRRAADSVAQSARAAERKLASTAEATKKTGAATAQSAVVIEKGWARASTAIDKFADKVAKNEQHLNKISSAATRTGLIVGAGLGAAAKAAIDWESAWAGVTKTVDGSSAQMAQLEQQLRGMTKTLPATHGEIAAVAEAAGQLGVRRQDIAAFTKVMVDLGESTNLTSEEASSSLAQFMNVMQSAPENVGRLGAAIVALGNDGASTERDIVSMAQRISGVGRVVGLTETDVLAYAAALSNVGIEAEAGGSAISTLFFKIDAAVSDGGEQLENFARISGMTSGQFKQSFETDAAQASRAFFEGLGRINEAGGDTNAILKELGITEIRQRDATLRLASSGDNLRRSLDVSGKGWKDNTALVNEAAKRYETTESQIRIAWNGIKDAAIDAGGNLLPIIRDIADNVAGMAQAFADLPAPVQKGVVGLGAIVAVGGLVIGTGAKMVTTVTELRAALIALGVSAPKASAAVAALGKAGLVAGLVTLASELQHVADVTKEMELGPLSADLIRFGATGKATGVLLKNFGEDFGGVAKNMWADGESLAEMFQIVARESDSWFEGLEAKFDRGSEASERIKELDAALANLVSSGNAEAAAAAFGRLRAMAEDNGVGLNKLTELLPQYQDAMKSAAIDTDLEAQAAKKAAPAQKELAKEMADSAKAAEEAQKELDAYIETLFKLPGLVLGVRDAQRGVQEAIDAATESLKENGRTLNIGSKEGRANQAALDAIAEAANKLSEEYLRTNASQSKMNKSAQSAREEFIRVAREMGYSKAQAKSLADQMIKVPDKKHTQVTNTAPAAKAKVVDYVKHGLEDIPGVVPTAITTPGITTTETAVDRYRREFLGRLPDEVSTGVKVTGIPQAEQNLLTFSQRVDTTLGGIADQAVKLSVVYTQGLQGGRLGRNPEGKWTGGKITGPGGPTDDLAGVYALSDEEWVIRAASSKKYGDRAMASVNDGTATIIPGLAAGGKAVGTVGLGVLANTPRPDVIEGVAKSIASQLGQQLAKQAVVPPAGPPGSVRSFRGERLNELTIARLLTAERMLGAAYNIMQGSYSTRVAASGSTHAGGGVIDTDGPRGWGAATNALRKAGFAAWHRTPSQGPWGHHIHAIVIGDPSASPAAKGQVRDFLRGGDGLAGRASGGPVLPGTSYMVGERGPEILTMGAQYGHVFPGMAAGGPIRGRLLDLQYLLQQLGLDFNPLQGINFAGTLRNRKDAIADVTRARGTLIGAQQTNVRAIRTEGAAQRGFDTQKDAFEKARGTREDLARELKSERERSASLAQDLKFETDPQRRKQILAEQAASQRKVALLTTAEGKAAKQTAVELARMRARYAALTKAKQQSAVASGALKNAEDAFSKATDNARDAIDAHNRTLEEMARRQEEAVQLADQISKSLQSGANIGDLFEGSLTAKGTLFDLQKQADDLERFEEQLAKLRALGLDEDLIQQIIGKGAGAGGDLAAEIIAGGRGTAEAFNKAQAELEAAADKIGGKVANELYNQVVPVTPLRYTIPSTTPLPKRARGGPADPYARYWVGEEGPEILQMGPRGGWVHPKPVAVDPRRFVRGPALGGYGYGVGGREARVVHETHNHQHNTFNGTDYRTADLIGHRLANKMAIVGK
jgi:TP901 family phage tail tape measure protein